MPCYHPKRGWPAQAVNKSGKRSITFSEGGGFGSPLELPCGKCIGCRLERARQWSARIMHEAQFEDATCFLTLTYSPEHLPADGSLNLRHLQLFHKRLRIHFARADRAAGLRPRRLRFFACGEYGDNLQRPHYHSILFGEAFLGDRKPWKKGARGDQIYVSDTLKKLWGLGDCYIGSVSLQSAGYVARYTVKKVSGDMADAHYKGLKPEFMVCSKGIGRRWFESFSHETYRDDFVVHKGQKMPTPRYYDKLYAATYGEDALKRIKEKRIASAELRAWNSTPDRLAVREEVTKARISTLKRS